MRFCSDGSTRGQTRELASLGEKPAESATALDGFPDAHVTLVTLRKPLHSELALQAAQGGQCPAPIILPLCPFLGGQHGERRRESRELTKESRGLQSASGF